MNRTRRILTATGLSLTLSLAAGAGIAIAQEMEHGRTRPIASADLASNKVKTLDATMQSVANNVRG